MFTTEMYFSEISAVGDLPNPPQKFLHFCIDLFFLTVQLYLEVFKCLQQRFK